MCIHDNLSWAVAQDSLTSTTKRCNSFAHVCTRKIWDVWGCFAAHLPISSFTISKGFKRHYPIIFALLANSVLNCFEFWGCRFDQQNDASCAMGFLMLLECWTKRARLKTKLSAAPTISKGFESERPDKSSTNHTVAALFYILYSPASAGTGQRIRVFSQDVLICDWQCSVSATCCHQLVLWIKIWELEAGIEQYRTPQDLVVICLHCYL